MKQNKQKVFLGLDTSCYTTSAAIVNENCLLVNMAGKLLEVPKGGKGIRQSDMVFAHIRNMPEIISRLSLSDYQIIAIGVSVRPRPLANSYMPAFLVGGTTAHSLGMALDIPVYELSHQENHLQAGLWSAGLRAPAHFLFVHISGGTTEILQVKDEQYTLLQGTEDLSAGQFIDRVGVKLGLPFPAGPHLEKLVKDSCMIVNLPVAVKDGRMSFSGPCTAAERLIEQGGVRPEDVARGTFDCVAKSLARSVLYWSGQSGEKTILFVGGVAGNIYIKKYLEEKLTSKGLQIFFAKPPYSSDNAVGCALFAKMKYDG